MVGGVGEVQVHIRHEADHEVLFIHHGPNGLASWSLPRNKRSRSSSGILSGLCASFVVGARPGMVGGNERRIVSMNPKWTGACEYGMVPHAPKDRVGLGLIVVDPDSVTPAMRG